MTHNKKLDAGQLKKAENRKGCKKYPCRACMHCNNNYNYYYYAAALETFYPELKFTIVPSLCVYTRCSSNNNPPSIAWSSEHRCNVDGGVCISHSNVGQKMGGARYRVRGDGRERDPV